MNLFLFCTSKRCYGNTNHDPPHFCFLAPQYQNLVFAVMAHYFPAPGAPADYCNKPDLYNEVTARVDSFLTEAPVSPAEVFATLNATGRVPHAGDVKYIYLTKAGPGPIVQPAEESLLDPATGLPVVPGPKHKRMIIKN